MNINDVQVMSTPDHGSYSFTITQPSNNIEQAVKDIVAQAMQGNPGYVAPITSNDNSNLNFMTIPFGDSSSMILCNWGDTKYESSFDKLFKDDSVTGGMCEEYSKTFGVKWYRKDELQYSTNTDRYFHGIIGTDKGITVRERGGMMVVIFFKGCVADPYLILNQNPNCKVTYFWWMNYISMLLKQNQFEAKLSTKILQLKLKAEKEVFKTT